MHNKNFATAVQLSLTSLAFRELDPDTRTLLEAVAFFPQGYNENNSVSNMIDVLNKFCVLSMMYRSKPFVKSSRNFKTAPASRIPSHLYSSA